MAKKKKNEKERNVCVRQLNMVDANEKLPKKVCRSLERRGAIGIQTKTRASEREIERHGRTDGRMKKQWWKRNNKIPENGMCALSFCFYSLSHMTI